MFGLTSRKYLNISEKIFVFVVKKSIFNIKTAVAVVK